MKTVKEISDLTGISVRTLHYYDEIGLLLPTAKSEAGYRLYDDEALETLQQILFFREFELPLKQIKSILNNPGLDKSQIWQAQKSMLVAKKERLERLIDSIDHILKGENEMDFTVFNQEELEEMIDAIQSNMSEQDRAVFVEHYGSLEAWREQFLKGAAKENVQKSFQKVVDWYGSKDKAMEAVRQPNGREVLSAYQKQMGDVIAKLAAKWKEQHEEKAVTPAEADVSSFEVKQLVGEYDFLAKQLYQMEDVSALMLEIAAAYQNREEIRKVQDEISGEGSSEFIGRAIEAFYR